MKNVLLLLLMIGMFSCAKEDASVLTTSLSGTLKCINDNPLEGMTVDATDENGTVTSTITNATGEFTFAGLNPGNYKIHARTDNYYVYTDAEYDTIIADVWALILGQKNPRKQDLIAYHMIDFDNKITTYDKLLFQKMKDQEYTVIDYMPWRLIKMDDFESGNIYAEDNITTTVVENVETNVEILAFYIGDPDGNRCQ
ncbi:MAG TPA: carboxypeptidase-like regulatory domain-containing protein [Saprospiraceae bacterium]|nr:carboxypeptidase-like regulatory domain-containing protein [Saprospiraceae bacterium]